MKSFSLIIENMLIAVLRFYKKGISPYLPCACRFQPTCSEYMIEAIKTHGIISGVWLGIKRLFRCHPWGKSGYDPVPKKKLSDKDTINKS